MCLCDASVVDGESPVAFALLPRQACMNDRSRVGSRLPLASYNDTPFASLTIEVHRGRAWAFGESAKEPDLLRTAAQAAASRRARAQLLERARVDPGQCGGRLGRATARPERRAPLAGLPPPPPSPGAPSAPSRVAESGAVQRRQPPARRLAAERPGAVVARPGSTRLMPPPRTARSAGASPPRGAQRAPHAGPSAGQPPPLGSGSVVELIVEDYEFSAIS